MGDDFENAFSITYGLDYWAYLRKLPPQKVEANIWERLAQLRAGTPRDSESGCPDTASSTSWSFTPDSGDSLKGDVQIRNAAQLYPGTDTSLNHSGKEYLGSLPPERPCCSGLTRTIRMSVRACALRLSSSKRWTKSASRTMSSSSSWSYQSKEMVFSDYLEHNSNLPLNDVMDKLLVDARSAQAQTFKFMTDANIAYVDPLPALKRSAGQGAVCRQRWRHAPGQERIPSHRGGGCRVFETR